MNETMKAIWGMIVLLAVSLPFLALLTIIAYKVYRKFRPAKVNAGIERQSERPEEEPTLSPKPVNSRQAMIIFVGISLLVSVYGLITGFVVGIISNLIYIVFVFPLVLGINNGKLIADVVQKAKIRKLSQLVILSLLSAIMIYAALHYARYFGFQIRASLEISSSFSEALEEENLGMAKALVNYALTEETGHAGFVGYMIYRANEGVSIGRLSRSSGLNLGPVLTWLYWALEFGIIFGLTIQKGKKVIGMSFCEACGNWYGKEKHLGGTATANESFLLDLIQKKDFSGLGKLIEKNAEVPSLEVYFQGCEVCGKSSSQLVVRRALQNTKGGLQFRDALQTVLQPTESSLLLSQLSYSGD